jgi:hypothetical protein
MTYTSPQLDTFAPPQWMIDAYAVTDHGEEIFHHRGSTWTIEEFGTTFDVWFVGETRPAYQGKTRIKAHNWAKMEAVDRAMDRAGSLKY